MLSSAIALPAALLSPSRAGRGRRVAALVGAAALLTACSGSDPAPGESEGSGSATSAAATTQAASASATGTSAASDASASASSGSGGTSSGTTGASESTTGASAGTGASASTGAATESTTGTSGEGTDGTTTGGVEVEVLPSAGCGLRGPPVGHFDGLTTVVDGVDRSYDLFVPEPYDPSKPHAVIFSYHGVGGTANTDQFRLDKNSAANDGYSINVAPQGWPSMEWNENHFVPFNLDASLQVFDQVLDKLAAEYCVDLNRVYAIGHSNGGQMAFHLGCLRGDRVRAIFPSGGRCFSYGAGVCDPDHSPNMQVCSGPVVVYSVMGEEDTTRHADEEATLAGFRGRQGCGAASAPVDPAPCLGFEGCNPGEEVASCRIPGLAHAIWKPGLDPIYGVMMSL